MTPAAHAEVDLPTWLARAIGPIQIRLVKRPKKRHWPQKISMAVAAGAAACLVAIGTAPAVRADDAALAGWLTKAFDPIQKLHVAENALIPILAPEYSNPDDDNEAPLEDVNALKAPCDQLRDANVELEGLVSAPDPDLSAEIHQAVDNVDTAVQNCAQTIAEKDTDRKKARSGIQGQLSNAEAHLASADIILAKLAKPK